ncbi:MAG: hypothetical protein HUJ51_01650 [Eggerthellaceae bacterium]|nr:hypothetical protein [Eggerthellaceae bacterium]
MVFVEIVTVVLILSNGSLYFHIIQPIAIISQLLSGILCGKGPYISYESSFTEIAKAGYARDATRIFRLHVQFGYTRTSPFQRSSKVSTMICMIMVCVAGMLERIPGVPE